MSIIDRIRELFGGKRSGAEHTALAGGGAVAATSGDDSPYDQSQDSGWSGDAGSSGDGGGGGGGDGGGGV